MKKNILYTLIFFTFVFKANSQAQINSVEPALEIFSKYPNVRDFTLGSSGKEAYFTIQSPLEEISVIVCIKKKNKKWQQPELVDFSGSFKDLEPFLSPDNKRLYFVSNRPINDSTDEPKDYDIWYVERANLESKWSKPINLGEPVNTEYDEFYPSVATNGNLYFTRNLPDSKGEDDIFFSANINGSYGKPVSLDTAINSEGYEFNAFIAPDESYIIFSGYNRKDGFGSGDLYISYRNNEGIWEGAKNLGKETNSKFMDYCPFVDVKNNILYFTSKRSEIDNKPLTSIKEIFTEVNKYQNGFSRVYRASFKMDKMKN